MSLGNSCTCTFRRVHLPKVSVGPWQVRFFAFTSMTVPGSGGDGRSVVEPGDVGLLCSSLWRRWHTCIVIGRLVLNVEGSGAQSNSQASWSIISSCLSSGGAPYGSVSSVCSSSSCSCCSTQCCWSAKSNCCASIWFSSASSSFSLRTSARNHSSRFFRSLSSCNSSCIRCSLLQRPRLMSVLFIFILLLLTFFFGNTREQRHSSKLVFILLRSQSTWSETLLMAVPRIMWETN